MRTQNTGRISQLSWPCCRRTRAASSFRQADAAADEQATNEEELKFEMRVLDRAKSGSASPLFLVSTAANGATATAA